MMAERSRARERDHDVHNLRSYDDWDEWQYRRSSRHSRSSQLAHSSIPYWAPPTSGEPPPDYSEDLPNEVTYYEEVSCPRYYCRKLNFACTRRGILHLVQIGLSVLSLSCAVASLSASPGYKSYAELGSQLYYSLGYAYSGFTGEDAKRLNRLDLEYRALKIPAVNITLGVTLGAAALSFTFLLLGMCKIDKRAPGWLPVEAIICGILALGLVPALAFYLKYNAETVYDSNVCRERAKMLASRNYQSPCNLSATEIVAALVAIVLAIAYVLGAVVAIQDFRVAMLEYQKKKQQREEERRQMELAHNAPNERRSNTCTAAYV
uniref:MARVEL domain-containing protein 3-like n=1 Tax=Myxine glutinosa TaxID=7769 RepID=UPI00358EF40A